MGHPRLLIRLGSLGDVILATAAAQAAGARWGDGAVDVLVKAEWAPVWNHHPAVREVVAWPGETRGPAGLWSLSRTLRSRNYREVFDLQGSPRTRALAALAGWSAVRRPERQGAARRRLVRVKRGGPPAGFRMVSAFVETVVPGGHGVPSVRPDPADQDAARALLGPGTRIGLIPGAKHATKRWPLTRFVETGKRLVAAGSGPVAVFFGPDETELAAAWAAGWPDPGAYRVVQAPLGIVGAALAGLEAVLTNDTGLMHLAAAAGTRVVALFGPTVRSFGFEPAGEGHRILEVDLPCRPCSLHGGPACPETHFRCLTELPVERALDELLAPTLRTPAP